MTLIKVKQYYTPDDLVRLFGFYRKYPVVAANHLLMRDGEPVTLAPIQAKVLDDWWRCKFNILTASRGSGKSVPLDTNVLTPSGWIKIKDLKIGDKVVTPEGSYSKIEGVYPQGITENYKINFADGRSAVCCKDHLWKVIGIGGLGQGRPTDWQVHKTKDIKDYLDNKAKKQHQSLRVPLVEDLFTGEDKELPIHPYVMGALIGDGNYSHNSVNISTADTFIVEKIRSLLPSGVEVQYRSKYDYGIRTDRGKINPVTEALKSLGCRHQRCWEKKIPREYLNLNKEQTLQLLQGLLDTDGSVEGSKGRNKDTKTYSRVELSTTSKELAYQVQQLIWKLGGICNITSRITSFKYKGIKKAGRESYRVKIRYKNKRELFSLPRKLERLKDKEQYSDNLGLRISSIVPIDPSETVCIKIEDPEGLFVIDNYVVTHNTFMSALYIALRLMLYPDTRLGVFAPAFRQSKFIFSEFQKFYNSSPMLQECVAKEPTVGSDQAYCYMKPVALGRDPSFLKALPIGTDGAKIRGERFSCFFLDESAQVPENIFRSAIKPMLSTSISPMKKVKAIAEMKQRYGNNFTPDMLDGENGYTVITSGFYQFNYWWEEILKMWYKMKMGSKNHSLNFIPYTDLPEGFLNMAIVQDAMVNDPRHVFLTEWCAEWIADSEGAFPMSLLERSRDSSIIPYSARPANSKSNYVFGIDVARDRDSTAIVVVEVGYPSKVVWITELEETPFPDQARHLFSMIERFNPVMIYMDSGGGGSSLQDSLADPTSVGASSFNKVISIESEPYLTGKRILKMCEFSSAAFVEDMNNNTKTLLEQGALKIPTAQHPIEAFRKEGSKGKKEVDLVEVMVNQVASIVISATTAGRLRYDLPKNGANNKTASGVVARKKDLYTAFVLAGCCVYDMFYKTIEERRIQERGVIKEIGSSGLVTTDIGATPEGYTISNNERQAGTASLSSTNNKTFVSKGGIIISRNGRR